MLLKRARREHPADFRQSASSGGSFESVKTIVTVKGKTMFVQTGVGGCILECLKVEETVVGGPIVGVLVGPPVNAGFVEVLGKGGPFQGETVEVRSGTGLKIVSWWLL